MKIFRIILLSCIFSILLVDASRAEELTALKFKTEDHIVLSPVWPYYFRVLQGLNSDRLDTLSLSKRNFHEVNPLLGRHPTDATINGWFAMRALLFAPPLLEKINFPEWAILSLLDTSAFMSEWITDLNDRAFRKEITFSSLPIGAKLSFIF